MPRQIAFTGASVLPLLLYGAGGIAGSSDDACGLLTQSQVGTALGVPVQTGKETSVRTCQWDQSDVSGSKGKHVTLTIFGQMGRLSPVDRFNNSKQTVSGIAKTPVSGVGDEALFIPTLGIALNVKSGNSAFQIRVSGAGLSEEDIKRMEIALAKQAISKL
jgi:hypothetical protein